ncbi:hypothetical protein ACQPT2_12185 [Erwinia amylovora]
MAVIELHQPKLAETLIDDSVMLREAEVGRCCEILLTAIWNTPRWGYQSRAASANP